MNKSTKAFICAAEKKFGKGAILTRSNIDEIVDDSGVSYPYWLTTNSKHRAGRGLYKVPVIEGAMPTVEVTEPVSVDLSAQVMVLRQPKLQDEIGRAHV